ncbi:MAG TPA: hypothetical protein VJZ71_16135 [Phycisphaerae bacterium]|nr:hypothetical protein [Phycisphaerae bacterium]
MMNPRERTLAIVVGGIVGLGAVYQGMNLLFLKPADEAKKAIADLEGQNQYLDTVIRSRRNLADRWNSAVSRTLAFDRPEASNKIAQALKDGAKRHGFENPGFFPNSVGSKIGAKTGITTVSYRITAEGPFKNAMDFLTDIYRSPYLCDISRLSITPLLQRNRPRGEVKIEFFVESPLMPKVDPKKVPELVNTASLPGEGADKQGPSRDDIPLDEELALLGRRNIFRPFVPPPSNVVIVDNQDWKMVVVRAKFFWEGEVIRQTVDGNQVEEVVKTVQSKSNGEIRGLGDAVEIQGTYIGGKTFGPQRFDFVTKKDWTYAVAQVNEPPPPTVVRLAADNKHAEPVDLEVSVTLPDGQTKIKPTIRLRGATAQDIDDFEVKSLTVTATYASGRKAPPATYTPSKEKQTYVVPVEPVEIPPEVAVDPSDQPPDPSLTVTGLVTYRGKQELIASAGPADRRIISAGEAAVVDGGMLLGVHPLGGVVKMPSGNYYIYPLGRPFTQRVKLEAKSDEELPAAIDAWSRPDSGESETEPEAESAAIEAVAGE